MNVPMLVVTSTLAFEPIGLDAVLASVESHHPLIRAASNDVEAARGVLLSEEGSFDTYLKAKAGGYAAGFYDGIKSGVEVRQPTRLWGAELYAGYRNGIDHPIYDGGELTSRAGEVAAGIMVPLWRDGPTDERRTRIRQAELGIDIAALDVREKLLATKLKAAMTYWKWAAAHEKLRIAADLQTLAEQRAAGITERVARGDLPELELIDNERLIVARLEDVVEARREVQARAFALSLFLRDDDGRPRVAKFNNAPRGLPEPTQRLPIDGSVVERAFANRPELARYQAIRDQLKRELELASNQRAPRVDLSVEGSQDFGEKRIYGPDPGETTKNETTVGLALSFAWPVQQRKALGKERSTEAKLRSLDAKQSFVKDTIEMEIRDAWSAFDAARARVDLARRTYELTQTVERSERRRFELGASSILQVNLREEASAKAAKDLVDALVDCHSAESWFRAVTAVL